jgi:gamma-glutamyl-gamma-aminobutyrate hydrolase PuuD
MTRFLFFIFAFLLATPARAHVKLLLWHPVGHDFAYLLAQRDGETPQDALRRYLSTLRSDPDLARFLEDLPPGGGMFSSFAAGKAPTALVLANETTDLAAHSARIHRFLDPLAARGCSGVVLPVAATAGLPEKEAQEFRALVGGSFQGLIALGGDDIHPSLHGTVDDKGLARQPNLSRDKEELAVVKDYLEKGSGIFTGVCRGHQMGSVASGCQLVLDLKEELGVDHPLRVDHRIRILDEGSGALTRGLVGAQKETNVMSLHHQAVKLTGQASGRVQVTAVDAVDPRIVEAVEYPRGFSTQTHPELMPGSELHRNFFDLFSREMKTHVPRAPRWGCRSFYSAFAHTGP